MDAVLDGDGSGVGVPHGAVLVEFGESMLRGDECTHKSCSYTSSTSRHNDHTAPGNRQGCHHRKNARSQLGSR